VTKISALHRDNTKIVYSRILWVQNIMKYTYKISNKRSNKRDSYKPINEIKFRRSINHICKNGTWKASHRENILSAAIPDSAVLLGVATVMKWINMFVCSFDHFSRLCVLNAWNFITASALILWLSRVFHRKLDLRCIMGK
jgi:hypothetical protein